MTASAERRKQKARIPAGNSFSDSWLPQLLQTTDSLFPTGSYAHSFGLEGMVHLGFVSDAQSLERWLSEQVISSLTYFELPFVRLALLGNPGNWPGLAERYGAMKGSSELRRASLQIGEQRLAMLARLWPASGFEQLRQAVSDGKFSPHATIVFGIQSALSSVPAEAALTAFCYQSLSALISAAMKLLRLGQNSAQIILSNCLGKIPEVIAASLEIEPEDIGWFQPLLDIGSARHERAYTRIFIS